MSNRPKIICFEGIDASGKETQVRVLASKLKELGFRVATVSFPRYETEIGKLIKKGLKKEIPMSDETLHGLLELDRYDFLETLGSFQNYDFLIFDRFTLSNLAFGMAKGIDINWIKEMQKRLPTPDLTFVLDITAETSYKRKSKSCNLQELDKHELDSSLLNRARMAYLVLAKKLSKTDGEDQLIYVIDANGNPAEVHEMVMDIVRLVFLTNES